MPCQIIPQSARIPRPGAAPRRGCLHSPKQVKCGATHTLAAAPERNWRRRGGRRWPLADCSHEFNRSPRSCRHSTAHVRAGTDAASRRGHLRSQLPTTRPQIADDPRPDQEGPELLRQVRQAGQGIRRGIPSGGVAPDSRPQPGMGCLPGGRGKAGARDHKLPGVRAGGIQDARCVRQRPAPGGRRGGRPSRRCPPPRRSP